MVKREEKYIRYYKNGNIMIKSYYKNGKREGEYIEYYENCEIRVKFYYKNDKFVGGKIY